ncbi:hypothetical protein TrRE_jg13054 [Triparma retinervis]|uniref:Ankyrin repeat protein n=1 Tax=Triparma retinervis TaxID=2557542 RepID=A0A9W6ZKI6_9STRA|nr:hypothetical protein TrRE_jg13054 [Triparma retinervis]
MGNGVSLSDLPETLTIVEAKELIAVEFWPNENESLWDNFLVGEPKSVQDWAATEGGRMRQANEMAKERECGDAQACQILWDEHSEEEKAAFIKEGYDRENTNAPRPSKYALKVEREKFFEALQMHFDKNPHLKAKYEDKRRVEGLNHQLFEAAQALDAKKCDELITSGAQATFIRMKGKNAWYEGNSATALSEAIKKFDPSEPIPFIDTARVLLNNGADVHFSSKSGNWNRLSSDPLMCDLTEKVAEMQTLGNQITLLMMFVDKGAELNKKTRKGKQGSFNGWEKITWSVFDIVKKVRENQDLAIPKLYLECGLDVNCAASYWAVNMDEQFTSNIEHKTLLHETIMTGNLDLVKMLLDHGADVNQSMMMTVINKSSSNTNGTDDENIEDDSDDVGPEDITFFVLTCLDIAAEVGSEEISEALRNAGAPEVQCEEKGQGYLKTANRGRRGREDECKVAFKFWKDGGTGKLREKIERERKKEERKRKKGKKKGGKKK